MNSVDADTRLLSINDGSGAVFRLDTPEALDIGAPAQSHALVRFKQLRACEHVFSRVAAEVREILVGDDLLSFAVKANNLAGARA